MNWSLITKSKAAICFCFVVFYSFFDGFSFSGGPTDPATGLPPHGNCSKCHSGITNAGPGQIILNIPSSYIPGNVYPIEVKVIQRGTPKFGFQATIVNSQNLFVGQFDTTGSDGKCQLVFNDTTLITHTNQSHRLNGPDSAVYTFLWKAPIASIGQVKMFVSAVGANNDFLMGDDSVISTTATIPVFTSSVAENQLNFKLYPTINAGNFVIELPSERNSELTILNANGQLVSKRKLSGVSRVEVIESLENGVYWAVIRYNSEMVTRKFFVIN